MRLAVGRSVQFLRVCTWQRDGRLVVIDLEQRGRSRDDEGAELTTFLFVQV